jgi:hypothetical protein
MIYVTIIMGIGFYIASIIYRHNDDVDRIIRARKSIIEDLAKIAENIEENNRLLAKIIGRKLER